MEPSPREIWILRKLSKKGLLTTNQVKQIFTNFESAAKSNKPLSIEEVLAHSGYLEPVVYKEIFGKEINQKTNPELPKESVQTSNETASPFSIEELFAKIENFEYQKLLGQGNIGTSYLGNFNTNEKVVIKVLKPKLLENDSYINSIKKTINENDYRNNKNLIPQEFRQTKSGDIYFVSKYTPSNSLKNLITQSDRFEIDIALNLILKISGALRFFEQANTPHLGLHPDNIFMDAEGLIRIKDFEWNRAFFTNTEDRIEYGPGISFMAPEHIKGTATDQTTDIYSLGVTLYFMLTRKLPFLGNADLQITKKIKPDYVPIEEIHRDIPLIVSNLVKKMLEPDKTNRFQSYNELMDTIQSILAKRQPVEAPNKINTLESSLNSDFGKKEKISIERSKEILNPIEVYLPPTEKKKNRNLLLFLMFIGLAIFGLIYFTANQPEGKTKQDEKRVVKQDVKVDGPISINNLEPIQAKPTQAEPAEQVTKASKIKEVTDRIRLNKTEGFDPVADEKKFSKRLNSIKVIQENLASDPQLSREIINEAIGGEIEKVHNERQAYWDEKEPKLKKSFIDNNEKEAIQIIDTIKSETANDEFIQNKIFNLRVQTQQLEPEASKNFVLDNESKLLKETIDSKATPLLENHDYAELVKLYSEATLKERNATQRQIYKDHVDFFEHAEKIKTFSQNINITEITLLRSLYLDEDGVLEAVSSKGFHVKNSNNTIIPWKNIPSKTLAALAAKYKPTSLGECISLLIYSSRVGNHVAMQTSLRIIEQKYFNYLNTPLIRENIEKLKELNDILSEDAIKNQLGLINILKARNNLKSKREAEILIKELRDEYLTNPVYKKFEREINDINAVLDQIK